MWTGLFWRDCIERVVSTVAQAAVGVLSVDGLGLVDVDWQGMVSVAGMAGLLSFLKCLAAAKNGITPSASLIDDTPGKHAVDRVR